MSRALSALLGAFVAFLLSVGNVAGAQDVRIPADCATDEAIEGLLGTIANKSYAKIVCSVGGQQFDLTTGHIWYALKHFGSSGTGYPYKDFAVNVESCSMVNWERCQYVPAGLASDFMEVSGSNPPIRALYWFKQAGGTDPPTSAGYYFGGTFKQPGTGNLSTAVGTQMAQESGKALSDMGTAYLAWKNFWPGSFKTPFRNYILTNMTFALTAPASSVWEPTTGGETPDPSGSTGGNVTNNYNVECDKPGGGKSTAQYECTPKDQDTSCNVINLPCNLKALFVPRSEVLKEIFSAVNITHALNLPVVVSKHWEFDLLGQHVKFDWNVIELPQAVKNFILATLWLRQGFWVMAYLGMPLPFGNPRGGSDVVRSGVNAYKRRSDQE